jgi:glucose/arabinose dehydrogenase
VALHGPLIKGLQSKRGYRVVRISESGAVEDFITGFFEFPKINGRPADIFNYGDNAFLLTDDHSGVVYYVYKK